MKEDFLTWASATSRTLEERFALLRVCETIAPDPAWPQRYTEQAQRLGKERRYDAAYRPQLTLEQLERLAGVITTAAKLNLCNSFEADRPLRDASFLRFMPGLQELELWETEIESLEDIRHCTALQKVRLRCNEVEDYSPLAACMELYELDVQTWHPWPDISALRHLPKLERLAWNAPGHTLQSCAVLPNLRELEIDTPGHHQELVKSVRDFYQLPEMPELREFWGGTFYRLDGIERYRKLRTARITGYFKDLSPLTGLPELTHLRLSSDKVRDLAPVARIPRLFHFALNSVRPQDYTTLMDAPALRELFVTGCDHLPQPDADMVRAMMPQRDELFAWENPPQPAPIRVIVSHGRKAEGQEDFPPHPEKSFKQSGQDWGGCEFMHESEVHWMVEAVQAALAQAGFDKHPGIRFRRRCWEKDRYRLFSSKPRCHSRSLEIDLLRPEAISRLREVCEVLRPVLIRGKWPWSITLYADPEPDAEEWDEYWKTEPSVQERFEDMLEEEEEQKERREREQRLLADEHRLKIMEEESGDTSRFVPTPPAKVNKSENTDDISEESPNSWDEDEDQDAGGLAEADSGDEDNTDPWLPQPVLLNPNIEWSNLRLILCLTSEGLWIWDSFADACEYLIGVKAEWPRGHPRA